MTAPAPARLAGLPLNLTPGARIGPYEIISPIGEGGMGVVYRARDPRLDRQVAIKLLPLSSTDDPGARERLRFEAMAAAALDHPYICKVFEIGEHEGAVFLVMEYIPGETLDQRLRAGRLPNTEALHIAGEIAEALQEAHARGFIHRDLKPANIMLTGQGHVKIMDFGLAKRITRTSSGGEATGSLGPELTQQGTVLGTPSYMSPEQVKGEPLDARSDIFSFGVILVEMLGAKHPFKQASSAETIAAVLREPPALSADTKPQVRALAERLLAKDPARRLATMSEVRAEMKRLGDEPFSDPQIATIAIPSASGPASPAASSAATRMTAVAVGAIGVGLAAYFAMRGEQTPPVPASRPAAAAPSAVAATAATATPQFQSIAVLPLDNYSGDPKQDYFAEGMTDELTGNLATISRLRVTSRGSAMQFQGKQRPATPEIAQRLNVDAVVEGSVQRVKDRVRITVQLIDARADRHVWAKTFEGNSRDVLALQAEMASSIAREINVQLTPGEKSRLASVPSLSPESHDAYLRARYLFNRPSDENLQKAIAQFEESIKLDAGYAPAYSGLSDAYLWAGYNEGFISSTAAKPKAKAAGEKAVHLDDNSVEAHTSLAVFKMFYDHDWTGSEREFRRAFALNDNYAFAHDQFGLSLGLQGRFDEAKAEGRRAMELDPLSPQVFVDALITYMFTREVEAARSLSRKAAALDPTFFFPVMTEGWADLQVGRFKEAIPLLRKAKGMGAPPFVSAFLAFAQGASGDRKAAMAEFEDLKRVSGKAGVLPFNRALVHLGLGEKQLCLDNLELALAADSQTLPWVGKDHMFDSLRSEPRFAALLKKLRL